MKDHIAAFQKFLLETKKGKILLLVLVTLLLLFIILSPQKNRVSPPITVAKTVTKATTHFFSNNIDPIDAQLAKTPPKSDSQNFITSFVPSVGPSSSPCPMKIYAAPSNEEITVSEAYLPYGRLIKCVLINTVDSSHIATPIIGMVTEDVWQNGICVIPAGTEVHGIAQTDRSRERIASEKEWIIVWQDGKELSLKGIALSNTQHGRDQKWSITDGSAGLEGEILKSDKLAQLKEIIASTVSAAGIGLVPVTTTTSPFGNTQVATTGSAQAVLGETVQAAGRVYAEQIMQSIQRDGWFVRCKAGSSFYLYTLETIDLANAHIGSSKPLKEQKITSN